MKQALLAWSCWLAFAVVPPAHAASEPLLTVTLNGFAGLPADSSDRREFMAAFHATMDAGELPGEKRAGEVWTSAGMRLNRFRLVDMAPTDQAWRLDLSIGVPPEVRVAVRRKPGAKAKPPRSRVSDVRVSRGLTIVVAALSPRAAGSGVAPISLRFSVYFADARRILAPSAKLPSGGYDYPWADAGQVVALAALEALHRANGELLEDERMDLSPATRADVTP